MEREVIDFYERVDTDYLNEIFVRWGLDEI